MLVPTGRSYDIRAPFSPLSVAFPLAPTSDKLCLGSIRDPHESQTSLAIPSLPKIYPCLLFLHHHTPGLNKFRFSTLLVPRGNRYLGILPGESYSSICALADLFVIIYYTNRLSGVVANLVTT
jgi:hypothetical protein